MSVGPLIILAILLGSMAATVRSSWPCSSPAWPGWYGERGSTRRSSSKCFTAAWTSSLLVVVLFFVLCGNIMTTGSIVKKLINTANVVVGWLPGGLAMAGILACGKRVIPGP